MRIAIFDPYLDTMGGGERYVLTMASLLSHRNDVYVFWDDPLILRQAKIRFNLGLEKIKTIKNIFSQKTSFLERALETKRYDIIIYISDGSIPFLLAKKNILILQFPVNWVKNKSIYTNFKLGRISKIICYSNFVKSFLDKTFKKDSVVIPPAISDPKNGNFKKEKTILTVGRFTKAMNNKKQEVLIDFFIKNYVKNFSGWKFVLIGSVLPQDTDYVENLKTKIKNFPIEIIDNVSFEELTNNYKKAKIYWHAAGFEEDLNAHPERAEHFGISTVEAMSYGCVPVAINAGGQKEIVEDGKNGFLWNTENELIKKTNALIGDDKLWAKTSLESIRRSKDYNEEKLLERLEDIIRL